MAFTTTIKVRFGDEDHARIVYYPRFFHFFHEAFEDLFAEDGGSYRACLDSGVGWPAVHAEADYERPVRFGDELVMDVTVTKIGTKSATLAYVGTVRGQDGPAVRGSVTVVCIDMATMRGREIPPVWRALFERHLATP